MKITKKTLIILIILLIVVGSVWLLYTRYFLNNQEVIIYEQNGIISTGGESYEQPQELINEAKTTTSLKNQLPYVTDEFQITEYDYSKGKFVVEFNKTQEDNELIFINWLENSEFSAIPLERFKLITKEEENLSPF